ncbi:retropepsin-like domain-containing protein [Nonomuraea glycinis]|uniref:Aspartyl protease n=1 Tax=Nonomuraea glycinis TaxID=2047744 RepID=A0A918A123_9ACTN|nr:retropepsin-like aspartic protease [Nonomuraea glycinis]MCA2176770.1 retropepsin-like domain-containing protein [Nonomuraea glycinis]GGP03345.1 hypothetical protein GCM10012278_14190 [Nonomuraea glycinis]
MTPWTAPWARGEAARAAWSAWTRGDIEASARLASASGHEHLLLLTDLVSGRYASALSRYATLREARYRWLAALDEPFAYALLHLDRVEEAFDHVSRRRGERHVPPDLALRRDRPLTVEARSTVTLPFRDHPLAPYLPAVEGVIDGRRTLIHLDTGGTYLVMGTERAASLGIASVPNGRHNHGVVRTPSRFGIARELELDGAVLTNVPVDILPTFTGSSDLVIMGTNVLQRFRATVDHPGARLTLAPRGTDAARPDGVRIPFYLWQDHFMFARGGYGARRDLTFFIDSGLVHVFQTDDGGPPRQAATFADKTQYRSWGIPRRDITAPFLHAAHPVSLGPLEQPGHLLATTPTRRAPWSSFGGIRIHGLLSHAFLSEYAWTLDFDSHEYTFHGLV